MRICFLFLAVIVISTACIYGVKGLPPPPPAPIIGDGGDSATCSDGIRNQAEADVDCGGTCAPCGVGMNCRNEADCSSNYCDPAGQCSAASCLDKWKNQDETDADCGGKCGKCELNKICSTDSGCVSGYCSQDFKCSIRPHSDNNGNPTEGTKNNNTWSAQAKNSPKLSILLWISIILNLALIVIILFFIWTMRKKGPHDPVTLESSPIKKYIRDCLEKGYSLQAIRQSLIRNKWSGEEIGMAINEIFHPENAENKKFK